jgi:integrase
VRLESNRDGTAKVFLSQREYDRLLEFVTDDQLSLVVRLGSEVGLRHAETAAVTHADLSESMVDLSDVPTTDSTDHDQERVMAHWLSVYGKDTSGGREDGKRRDAFVKEAIARDVEFEVHKRDLDPDDEVIPVTARTIRRWVSDLGDRMAGETGNDDWSHLSTHDFRRYYATTMLQVHGMNPEVLMEVGGWDSYEALRPYLQSPVEEVIVAEFAGKGLL